MNSLRIFEIEGVWVDQKTIIISYKTGGWINPRVVGCFGKLKNKDQLNPGRKGLLPNSELVEHIISIDDMVSIYSLCSFPLLSFSLLRSFPFSNYQTFFGKQACRRS